MSPSEDIKDYADGWASMMKLVRNGYSWSGGERNRFFINGRKGAFYEMSHLAGLDHSEDGRGLAVVDWDQDGRLDLWYRNRSAPRLRLMHNQNQSYPSVSLRLEGTSCNRDAIGAVVELLSELKNDRSVQSVKAGDHFLSQSSKWLHFGLGTNKDESTAEVLWPNGQKETFTGIKAGRFHLKQGSGIAQQIKARTQTTFKQEHLTLPNPSSNARILLPARVPFPVLNYRDQTAKRLTTKRAPNPKLIILWSGSCPNCEASLKTLTANAKGIQQNGLEILALATDGTEGPASDLSPAYDLIGKTKLPFPWGFIEQKSTQKLHRFQEQLFDQTPTPSVPLSILLDQNHRALAIYRGELAAPTILGDLREILNVMPVQRYHLAPPLKGTWFTNPLPPREVNRLFPLRN